MKEHKFANGIVEFREAIEIDQEFFAGWLNRRRENEPNDYTIDDDGNYINRGGYRFTPEEYLSAPGRFLNLLLWFRFKMFNFEIHSWILFFSLLHFVFSQNREKITLLSFI